MTEEVFLSTHSSKWCLLESYCTQINKKGFSSLDTSQIKSFLNLFKLTSHHLAYAKTHYPKSQTISYLNNLVGQCNHFVYSVERPNIIHLVAQLFRDYNQLLKKYRLYFLLSFGIFMLGALISFLIVYIAPSYASIFLDQSMIDAATNSGQSYDGDSWNYALMSSYIMTNNIAVALKAFVFGVVLGIGTVYILFYNGTMLGSLTALFYLYGNPTIYWSLILPHGIIELTAIFISGAAGFMIAKGFLYPGSLTRWHGMIQNTKTALNLIGGVIILLVIAGIIEGFFTPLNIGTTPKLLFALLTAVLLGLYLLIPYLKEKPTSNTL